MVIDTDIEKKLKEHRENKKAETEKTVDSADLNKLKTLQADMDNIVVAFGQLAIQEKAIVSQKEELDALLVDIKKREVSLAAELSKKYGEGSLDISTGKFSSSR